MQHRNLRGADLHSPSNELVENNTGSTIPALKAVTFNSIGTAYPQITLANGPAGIVRGITQTAITSGGTGYICTWGILSGVNTQPWNPGTVLYADASGNITSTATGSLAVGVVIDKDSTNGIIYATNLGISIQSFGAITSLTGDVSGTGPGITTTTVNFVGGVSAANVALGATAANNATSVNTPNRIVLRDSSGNFSAGTITANLIGSATNFTGSLAGDVTGTQSATVVSFVGGYSASQIASAVASVLAATPTNTPSTLVSRDASGNSAFNVLTATAVHGLSDPINPTDAANKRYVDNLSQSVTWKDTVRSATTGALPSYTYNNGTLGVGATITATANGALPAQDGITLAVNDRLLVKDESGANQPYNGIYVVAQVGDAGSPFILARALDMDDASEFFGATVQVGPEASTQAGSGFRQNTPNPITVGTSNVVFINFFIGLTYVFHNGLIQSGNAVSVQNADASISVSAGGIAVQEDPAGAIITGGAGIKSNVDNSTIDINGSNQLEVKNAGITNAKLSNVPANTLKGNNTGVSATPADLTVSQVNAMLGDVTTIGTYDSQIASANGAVISGNLIYFQSASATVPGMVNTGTQTFAGNKTFTGTIGAANFSGSSSGTNTGDQTITLTNDLSGSGTSTIVATIQANVVSNSKLAQMAANTIKGNNTGSTANALDLTTVQVVTMLGTITALTGDVSATGPGSVSSTVNSVGGYAASAIAASVAATQAATSSNSPNTLVKRDGGGNFSAGTITASLTGHASLDLALTGGTMSGAINMNGSAITNVASPINPGDAANKSYVDNLAQSLTWKDTARSATTGALPAYTYNNGTLGVGATITANSNVALPAQDGVTLVVNDRLLVKNETGGNQPYNGIYVVTQVGDGSNPFILTRALDMDDASEFFGGAVQIGPEASAQAGYGFRQNTPNPITVGTTNISFVNFVVGISYSFTNGLQISGSTVSVLPSDNSLQTSPSGVSVKEDPAGAISTGTNGIKVNVDNVTVDINGSNQIEVKNNGVSNSKLAQMPANTLKGNNTGSTANASDLTISQVNSMLGDVTTVGTYDSQVAAANGAVIASNNIYFQSASATVPGMVNTGTQFFAGAKTFNTSVTTPIENITNYINFTQTSAPATPASTTANLFVDLSNTFSRLRFVDQTGLQTTLGRDSNFVVYNNSGSSITAGQLVYISGSFSGITGILPTIALASAAYSSQTPAFAMALETITNNNYGRVAVVGLVTGVNTSGLTSGQTLYLSPTSAGSFTTTQPTSPNLSQIIGYVVNAGASGSVALSFRTPLNVASGTNLLNFQIGPATGTSALALAFANAFTFSLSVNPSANFSWTLPSTQGGSGTYLTNDGSGNLSWSNPLVNIDGGSPTSNYVAAQIINGGTP